MKQGGEGEDGKGVDDAVVAEGAGDDEVELLRVSSVRAAEMSCERSRVHRDLKNWMCDVAQTNVPG